MKLPESLHLLASELPQIIEEPNNVTVNIGETASLQCRASGDPVPNYVWTQNSIEIPANDPRYHFLEDGTLRIANVNTDLVGEYECMAQNVVGEAKSRPVRMAINYQQPTAAVRVDGESFLTNVSRVTKFIKKNPFTFSSEMPRITTAPEDQISKIGSYVVLECEATGKISWKRNELTMDSSSRMFFANENTELHIDHIKESDEGGLTLP